jgi:hypothetical protein
MVRKRKAAQREEKQELTFLYEMESAICEYYNRERALHDGDVALTIEHVIQNLRGKQIPFEKLPIRITNFINLIQDKCKRYVEQREMLSSDKMIKCFERILASVKLHSTTEESRGYLEFVSKYMLKW